jgi:hypothetical protein
MMLTVCEMAHSHRLSAPDCHDRGISAYAVAEHIGVEIEGRAEGADDQSKWFAV